MDHRRTIAMMFYRNARELSELQLWNSLGRIAKVQRYTDDVDAVQLQYDLRPLLRWSASCPLSDNLARVTGGLVGYLEENDISSAMMNEDGSWLNASGKIVARLWIVGLTPPRFQMTVGSRCEFLSIEDDPARVMEVTQQMVETFEKAEQLLEVTVPMDNGKKTNGDGGEVAVGGSVKSAGSSPKKTSSFRGRCDDCGENGHKWRHCKKRFGHGGDGVRKGYRQSQDASRTSDNGNRSGKYRFISAEKPKVVSAAAVSQGPSSRSRALKEEEKGPQSRTRMRQ